jgi:hypothetical protein
MKRFFTLCLLLIPVIALAQVSGGGPVRLNQLAPSGATVNQIIKFDGTKWGPATPSAASIITPNVIHLTTAGNDTTGDGTAAAPYRTAQRAFDAAIALGHPCALHFGVGVFGNLVLTNADMPAVTLIGQGADLSVIGTITGTLAADTQLTLLGNGARMVRLGNIAINGAHGATPGADGKSVTVSLTSLSCSGCTLVGGNGVAGVSGNAGNETTPGSDGSAGGDGGSVSLVLIESICSQVTLSPGGGAFGGTGGDDGGVGAGMAGADGAGGAVMMECVDCPAIDVITTNGANGSELRASNSKLDEVIGFLEVILTHCKSSNLVSADIITAEYSTFNTLNAAQLANTKFCVVTQTDSSAAHIASACVINNIFHATLP